MVPLLNAMQLSPYDFEQLGREGVAYVRPVIADDERAVAIHAADGSCLDVLPDLATALASIKLHGLSPTSLH
jgi:hypothetical protein